MTYDNARLRQMLAAEYVLGTLVGGARRRFQRLMKDDPWLRGEVRYWQERFAGLDGFAAVPPRDAVWAEIERRIRPAQDRGAERTAAPRRRLWPFAVALAAAASLALVALLLRPTQTGLPTPGATRVESPGVVLTATLSPPDDDATWALRVLPDRHVLRLSASARTRLAAQSDYELWWLNDDGSAASLGLLPREGERHVALPPGVRITAGGKVAVSLEPAGGSPRHHAPSGPVLLAVPLVPMV